MNMGSIFTFNQRDKQETDKSNLKNSKGRCTNCNNASFRLKVIVGSGKILRTCKRCGKETKL